LVDSEREWRHELQAAAAMAAVRLGVARGWGATDFYMQLAVSVDDGG
jgi:hypothetical protein